MTLASVDWIIDRTANGRPVAKPVREVVGSWRSDQPSPVAGLAGGRGVTPPAALRGGLRPVHGQQVGPPALARRARRRTVARTSRAKPERAVGRCRGGTDVLLSAHDHALGSRGTKSNRNTGTIVAVIQVP